MYKVAISLLINHLKNYPCETYSEHERYVFGIEHPTLGNKEKKAERY